MKIIKLMMSLLKYNIIKKEYSSLVMNCHNIICYATRKIQDKKRCHITNHSRFNSKENEYARAYDDTLIGWKEEINDLYLPYAEPSYPIATLRLWALKTYYKYRKEESIEIGTVHGLTHWDRVFENGQKLLDEGVNEKVVAAFAYTHDVFRNNDGNDYGHGPRASEMIKSIRNTYLGFLNNDEFELLCEACKLHTVSEGTDNPTLNACFDSDRLDLGRVGIIPDPDKMCSIKGQQLAKEMITGNKMY